MIVISGALVLVALVLLVAGIVGTGLGFVYASIAVSLLSLGFLVVGILQRRGETLPGDGATTTVGAIPEAPADRESSTQQTAVPVASERRDVQGAPSPQPVRASGEVLVVAGRPRYHVQGCRYLADKDAEVVAVTDARDQGFTPCGVCRPDEVTPDNPDLGVDEAGGLQDDIEPELLPVVARRNAPRPVTTPAASPVRSPATKTVTPKTATPKTATPKTATPKTATPKTAATAQQAAPGTTAARPRTAAPGARAKVPSVAAVASGDSTPATSAARRTGSVVVIPDRGRFHRAECRYVRGIGSAEVLSRAAATRQGYQACGVCKP